MKPIELEDGKYIIERLGSGKLHALRYGEPWRDLTGDGLVLALVRQVESLEECLDLETKDEQRKSERTGKES